LYQASQRLFMFHKNVANSLRSISSLQVADVRVSPQPSSSQVSRGNLAPQDAQPSRLILLPSGGGNAPSPTSSALVDFISVSAHRCSSFFAEAAVLVLVLGLLDRFLTKDRLELGWAAGAFAISLLLLAASIATEFTARRWLKAH